MSSRGPPGVSKERHLAPEDLPGTPKGPKTNLEGGEKHHTSHHMHWGKGAKQQRMSLWGKRAKQQRSSFRQVYMSISCFPPAQLIPLRIIGCGGPA